jgi:hypothetical protein
MMSDGVNSKIYWLPTKGVEDKRDRWISKLDEWLALLSLSIAIIPLVCLIYATLHYDHHLSRLVAWGLIVIGLLPTLLCVLLNVVAVSKYHDETSDEWDLREIESSIQLSNVFGNAALNPSGTKTDSL